MKSLAKNIPPACLIACGVFSPLLEHLKLKNRYSHLDLTFLPSNLHIYPQELKDHLLREITVAQKTNKSIICLYGECFPDIDLFCKQHRIIKVKGPHCYEILLGKKQFQTIMEETAKTFFLERDLIINFEEYCIRPLELYDDEMRELFFKNYERVVYVRQPTDPDLISSVREIANFLELSFIIKDADYSYIEKRLIELINPRHSCKSNTSVSTVSI